MTTIPGTYFTEQQLEAARKADEVCAIFRIGIDKWNRFGFIYDDERQQYDKALAWYLLAARENDPYAYSNIGELYRDGFGVPKNYLCALKWLLKAVEQNKTDGTPNHIGKLFESGQGVPLDKNKALEWYCRDNGKTNRDRLNRHGYHLSAADKNKSLQQLIKESEAILDAEKKKLEEKQEKTQQEMEALVDLSITYKLVDGVKDAWKDVPILFADDRQRYAQLVNSSNQVLELKKQTQLQEGSTLISQTKWLPPIKQEESIFQRQIEERDRQLTLLRNDFQLLHHKNVTLQQQINTNDSKTVLLQKENQGLKLKVSSLEHQGREKDNKINVLENEQHGHHRTSIQQTQTLNSLKQEKQTMEQERMGATNEVERLKSSYVILEQLLIAKQDTIMSLKRENQMLSTANQGNQQGANEMVDTLKTLLQSKNNEIELLKQNMEHLLANEQRRNDALEQENKMLKQEMPQQKANVQSAGPSNVNPTNSDSSHHDRHDNSYNDSNYESEKSDTGDINYDTPSEDEDNNNHLNYDDVNESNK